MSNNEMVSVPRGLLERIAGDSYQDSLRAVGELHALLTAPAEQIDEAGDWMGPVRSVPPAGGEPEVLGWVVTDMNGDFYFSATKQTADDTPLVDRAHVTRLQAEVESLKNVAKAYIASDGERSLREHALRAEASSYPAKEIDALVRELDVLLNGEKGAAPQAKLCDIVAQVRLEKKKHPWIKCLHENGPLIAAQATVAQQAELIGMLKEQLARAKEALKPENQMIIPVRSKCLACGGYHENSSGLPCPNMIANAVEGKNGKAD